MHRRARLATATVVLALLAGCGGGGGSRTSTPTDADTPGAAIDPNANGVMTGPINKARSTATELGNQQRATEQQTTADG